MTVVLALMCSDGLVIASDTQITESDRGMSYPGQKLHPLGDCAAWGGSGARGVLMEVDEALSASPAAVLEADDVPRALQDKVLPIMRHHYEQFIEDVPGEEDAGGPSVYVLAAGYARGEPFIVEVNPNGLTSRYEEIGFHAVGSGAPMAQKAGALLAHFRMKERTLDYGVTAAIRVLDALVMTAPSVGGPLDAYRMTPEGAEHLDEEAIERVRKDVARWEDLEQEAMDKLFD